MYLDEIAEAIRSKASGYQFTELALFRILAVLVLAKGVAVSHVDVHNAGVACEERTPAVPFELLTVAEAEACATLCTAAREAAYMLEAGKIGLLRAAERPPLADNWIG